MASFGIKLLPFNPQNMNIALIKVDSPQKSKLFNKKKKKKTSMYTQVSSLIKVVITALYHYSTGIYFS